MKTIAENISLIVVGRWNPAIIQPDWVSTNILQIPAGQAVPVVLEFTQIPGIPPRFTLQDLTYAPEYQRLSVRPNSIDPNRLAAAESSVIRILQQLPHTPVEALGQNFEFLEENPNEAMTGLFNLNDPVPGYVEEPLLSTSTLITKSFSVFENCVLNLSRTLRNDGAVGIGMNFHFALPAATQAATMLPGTFLRSRQLARQILDGYGAIPDDFTA